MNRDELMSVHETEVQPVPAGGKTYHVRAISADQMVEFDSAIKEAGEDVKKLLAIQLSTFLSNEAGDQVLSVDDALSLSRRLKARTVQQIVTAGMELNALTSKEQEAIRGN
jgi:hypothetical protein